MLAGILDTPQEAPRAVALFTHCFTCNKDLKSIVRISRRLSELGIAVLRYDWTGLGGSQGRFAETTFSTGLSDLRAAAKFCQSLCGQLDFLIGYSLGGAASLAAAAELPSLSGVVTLGAPSDTEHLADLLERMDPQIAAIGSGQVTIGGLPWQIERSLVDDLRNFSLDSRLDSLRHPVLLIHSLMDETVSYGSALRLFDRLAKTGQRTGGSTHHAGGSASRLREEAEDFHAWNSVSLLTLRQADHLLTRNPEDLEWISQSIARWMIDNRPGNDSPPE
jgi:putative redox protein